MTVNFVSFMISLTLTPILIAGIVVTIKKLRLQNGSL